jgi:uncharacterized protein (TIGR02466 family)
MALHGIFPVAVGEYHCKEAEKIKQSVFSTYSKHMNVAGYSEESTGHVTLHHEPEYEPLYRFAAASVRKYLDEFGIDQDQFDVNIVKSWFNILQKRKTPPHAHGDAHVSFSYYVSIPDGYNQAIRFHNYFNRFEPFTGCIRNNPGKEWNIFNSYVWDFFPSEGTMFVFPSMLVHETVSNTTEHDEGVLGDADIKKRRICIAGDVLLTYKTKQAKTLGLQPISNWKTFG